MARSPRAEASSRNNAVVGAKDNRDQERSSPISFEISRFFGFRGCGDESWLGSSFVVSPPDVLTNFAVANVGRHNRITIIVARRRRFIVHPLPPCPRAMKSGAAPGAIAWPVSATPATLASAQ